MNFTKTHRTKEYVRNLNAIRRFSHGCYVLIQPYTSLVGKSGTLFFPIHQRSIPCESNVQLETCSSISSKEKEHFSIPHGLECPPGLCAIWAWISLSRTGRPWFQRLTLNNWSHGVLLVYWQGRNEVTWRPSQLLIRQHLFSCQQGTLNHGNECLMKLSWVTCVSWCSLSIGADERYFT
jgi:hypothetical protein